MQAAFLIILAVFLLFAFVVAFGAPYLPTLKPQVTDALDLLKLKKGQTMLELGCGDGRVAKAAARRGIIVVGYELNPILVIIAKLHTWRYRRLVQIKWRNYWRITWPETDAVFVFLLDKYMKKLDKKIIQQKANQKGSIKLLSFSFQVPGRRPTAQNKGLYLYEYR